MDTQKINTALQDLIIRLQDAEKGYKELEKATSNPPLKKWLAKYATERHNMHRALEKHMEVRGGEPEVKTSLLGKMHRMLIDLKVNNLDDDFDAVVNEIKRGSDVLISDIDTVINELVLSPNLEQTLRSQKNTIQFEVNELERLKKELYAVEA